MTWEALHREQMRSQSLTIPFPAELPICPSCEHTEYEIRRYWTGTDTIALNTPDDFLACPGEYDDREDLNINVYLLVCKRCSYEIADFRIDEGVRHLFIHWEPVAAERSKKILRGEDGNVA